MPTARALEVVRQWHWDYSRDVLGNLPAKDIGRFLGVGAIAATLKLLGGILMREAAEFDAHPHLLNVDNGVLDLRTLELGRHDPDLLLTKLAPVDYVADATHPDVDAALKALPKGTRDYARLRFGQAITGYTPAESGGCARAVACNACDVLYCVPRQPLQSVRLGRTTRC